MAKIYKIVAYVVDASDDFETVEDFVNYVNNTIRYGGDLQSFGSETSREFEWEDDIDVNHRGCTQEQFEKYFDKIEVA